VIIADGAIIHSTTIERSVIGIRSRIEDGTTIRSSIIMGNDYYESLLQIAALQKEGTPLMGIGKNCVVENAIIDKNCRVGDNTTIIGDSYLEDIETDTYCIRDGIVILKKEAIIPPNSVSVFKTHLARQLKISLPQVSNHQLSRSFRSARLS